MHPNPAFRQVDDTTSLSFARQRGFGVLGVNGSVGPIMIHVPFLLSEDGKYAEFHLVRSNEISRLITQPIPATLSVSGPDGYVSPDWYGDTGQVPTWNYVAVHLRGHIEGLPDDRLHDILTRQVSEFENRIDGKPPWSMDKVDDAAMTRLMRMIRPARMVIERLESTWKLGQNKTDVARQGAADHLTDGAGHELQALADMMRNPPG